MPASGAPVIQLLACPPAFAGHVPALTSSLVLPLRPFDGFSVTLRLSPSFFTFFFAQSNTCSLLSFNLLPASSLAPPPPLTASSHFDWPRVQPSTGCVHLPPLPISVGLDSRPIRSYQKERLEFKRIRNKKEIGSALSCGSHQVNIKQTFAGHSKDIQNY